MNDILQDIESRMYALDTALPGNSAARDLLKILERARVEIIQLRVVIKMARDDALPSDSATPEKLE